MTIPFWTNQPQADLYRPGDSLIDLMKRYGLKEGSLLELELAPDAWQDIHDGNMKVDPEDISYEVYSARTIPKAERHKWGYGFGQGCFVGYVVSITPGGIILSHGIDEKGSTYGNIQSFFVYTNVIYDSNFMPEREEPVPDMPEEAQYPTLAFPH